MRAADLFLRFTSFLLEVLWKGAQRCSSVRAVVSLLVAGLLSGRCAVASSVRAVVSLLVAGLLSGR